MACKQNLDLRCVLVPARWVLGQNTSRMQEEEVHATLCVQGTVLMCATRSALTLGYHALGYHCRYGSDVRYTEWPRWLGDPR